MTQLLASILAAVPPDRDGAREAARRELSKRIYQPRRRGLVERVADWVAEKVSEAFERAASVVPGGGSGLLVLLLICIAVIVALRLKLGPLRRSGDLLHDERARSRRLTADDYRAEATAFAANGNWREALRARFRAAIRELEQRGILDERAGRTAGEIANESAAAMPAIGPLMRRAADTFNEVWYGDRPADRAAYQRIVEVDEGLRGGKNAPALTAR